MWSYCSTVHGELPLIALLETRVLLILFCLGPTGSIKGKERHWLLTQPQPGGPGQAMCSESHWVANPVAPLLLNPGPIICSNTGSSRGPCSHCVFDLAPASRADSRGPNTPYRKGSGGVREGRRALALIARDSGRPPKRGNPNAGVEQAGWGIQRATE